MKEFLKQESILSETREIYGMSVCFAAFMALVAGVILWFYQRVGKMFRALVGEVWLADRDRGRELLRCLFETSLSEENLAAGEEAALATGYTQEGYSLLLLRRFSPWVTAFFFLTAVFLIAALFLLWRNSRKRCVGELLSLRGQREETAKKLRQKQIYFEERQAQLQRFLEDVAHQWKTPLTSILLNLDLWEGAGEEEQRCLCQKSVEQVIKLQKHLKVLLDVARLENGKILFSKQDFSVEELLREVTQEFAETSLRLPESGEEVFYHGDRDWISEAIKNLVSNAAAWGTVEVELRRGKESLQILITDEGEGMDAQQQKHLFERYYIGKNKRADSTGIGLNLAYSVVKAHGGDIFVRSAEGGGSCMEVILPLYHLKNTSKHVKDIC